MTGNGPVKMRRGQMEEKKMEGEDEGRRKKK